MPSVSILLPTYNREKLLERAIQSVYRQTFHDYELIIIDDGSTDNTPGEVEKIADSRVTYMRYEQNQGQNHALNIGIHNASGKYIAFLDSDDEWLPDYLEEIILKFQLNEQIGAVYTQAYAQKPDGARVISHCFYLEGNIYRDALIQGYLSHMITFVVKKECFAQVGLFDESFTVCQDNDFCFRVAKKYAIGLIHKPLAVIYEDAGENRLIKKPTAYAEGWDRLITKFESDILYECGEMVLSKHLVQTGKYYLLARKKNKAINAFQRAYKWHKSIRNWIYIITAHLPVFVYLVGRQIMALNSIFRKPKGNL